MRFPPVRIWGFRKATGGVDELGDPEKKKNAAQVISAVFPSVPFVR